MIVQPKIRGFMCTTAHPEGCARSVALQIAHVDAAGPVPGGPKRVLVIGSSTGYGLASRITAAFGCGAATLGVFFERPADGKRTASAGWYNTCAFQKAARARGLYSKNLNGDAFSDEVKARACDIIAADMGQVDLVVYSVASGRRIHPRTGEVLKSTLKSITGSYANKSYDMDKDEVIRVELERADQEEVRQTVGVMGGEDWQMWMDMLAARNLLAPKVITVAYSYIGPEITQPIYRQGTIGAAKDHLEATAHEIDRQLAGLQGRAYISVNKAVVTQASSAIPYTLLYMILLIKVMKERHIYEGCIEQITRLFHDRLYGYPVRASVPVDEAGRIRLDDFEMRADIQKIIKDLWGAVDTSNVHELGTVEGYNSEFLRLFGFGMEGVDYTADVDIDLKLEAEQAHSGLAG